MGICSLFQVLVLFLTSEINGQSHTEGEGTLGDGGTLVIKPPKDSYQLDGRQTVQSPKIQQLINNEEPYRQDESRAPIQNKHSVIFEPIRNLKFSRSVYRLTSMIHFEHHINFFETYEKYLNLFLEDMTSKGVSDLINKPQESMGDHTTSSWPSELRNLNCSDASICANNNKKACYQWFLSICMNQRHYQQMLEDTDYVKQVFRSIKGNFYQAINHVGMRTDVDQELELGPNRQKRDVNPSFRKCRSNMDSSELHFVAQTLEQQVNGSDKFDNNTRHRRFGVDTLILGGGILANRHSIKTIQRNIKKIHEDNKRQDRQINTLAKLFNKLLFRVRQHDTFLHKLDARVIKIEHDLLNLLELNHYNSYTTYTLRDANYVLTRLLTGLTAAQQNAESIYTFLRAMSTHKLDPTVIPIPELVEMMHEVEEDIRESPRLALPIPIDEVEEYYQIIRISTVITEDTLIILLSIPLTDISLQMNLYRAHNLPAVHPELGLAATYQLEGEYLAIGQDGHYVALPDKGDVQICVLSRGGLCRMNQALYPTDKVQWCILALFQNDQEKISQLCKFDLSQRTGNLAHSLGGYLWAISATATEKLQVRCLKKTYIVIIGPPLQLVFIGDGCEGYSPSIAITAKTELTSIGNKPGRQTFFIGFNSLYQANPLIGIWANMGIDFMDAEDAEKMAITFTEIKGINMEEFKIKIQDLDKDTFEMPSGLILGVMVVSVIVILVTIALFIWKMYQMRGTLGKFKDIPNVLKSEPNISGVKKASKKAREVVHEFHEGAAEATPMSPAAKSEILKALATEFKGNPKQLKKYFKTLEKERLKTIPETDSELSS